MRSMGRKELVLVEKKDGFEIPDKPFKLKFHLVPHGESFGTGLKYHMYMFKFAYQSFKSRHDEFYSRKKATHLSSWNLGVIYLSILIFLLGLWKWSEGAKTESIMTPSGYKQLPESSV